MAPCYQHWNIEATTAARSKWFRHSDMLDIVRAISALDLSVTQSVTTAKAIVNGLQPIRWGVYDRFPAEETKTGPEVYINGSKSPFKGLIDQIQMVTDKAQSESATNYLRASPSFNDARSRTQDRDIGRFSLRNALGKLEDELLKIEHFKSRDDIERELGIIWVFDRASGLPALTIPTASEKK
uniref:Capsid protein n=1 Tax=Mangifera indica latent virus TaxID=1814004 RepID=A0A142D7P9_9VIRU|nr:hypothetical protein [Mangifera indica latent virus]